MTNKHIKILSFISSNKKYNFLSVKLANLGKCILSYTTCGTINEKVYWEYIAVLNKFLKIVMFFDPRILPVEVSPKEIITLKINL